MITYPRSAGRNFDEGPRVIDAMQITDRRSVVWPANWKSGDGVIVAPSVTGPGVLEEKPPRNYTELRPDLRMASDRER